MIPENGLQLWLDDDTASIFLHPSGDHIVIRFHCDDYQEILAHASPRWERWVTRALRASAFL